MKSDFTSRLKHGVSAFAIAAILPLSIQASYAADETAAADEEVTFEEVVVTGSRIKRADLAAPSPVAVVGADEFKFTGAVNVEQVLATLPQTIPGFGGSSNNPGNGTATVDLRGLGASRTLVLVNGRRYMPANSAGVVDLNTIPAALIERVEVMTGGASAVYGSDAMAGVVNFIMKKNFEGLEITSQYDTTYKGDGQKYTIDATIGGNFADDRGNATLNIGYMKREEIFQGDRDYSSVDMWDWTITPGSENDFGMGILDFGSTTPGWMAGGSTTIPAGRINVSGGQMFTPDGGITPFNFPGDAWNYAPLNYLQLPQERFMAVASARYEIADGHEVFADATFSRNGVPTQLAPTPAVFNGDKKLVFDIDTPFLQPAAQAWIGQFEDPNNLGYTVPLDLRRRMFEVGPRQEENFRTAFRINFGARGDISDDWSYEASYAYNRLDASRVLRNDINAKRMQQAIMTQIDPVTGELVCADGADAGCVPINVFGEGNISEEAAAFVRMTALDRSWVTTQVANAVVSGTVGDVTGAGDIGLALGVEWRKQASDYTPDQNLVDDNILGFNNAAPVGGQYDVFDIFGEAVVPLIKGLEASLAGRYSDYSTVGGVYSYSAGLTWAPIEDIKVRAQYQRAVRAPNVGELFAGQTNGFPSATDPCATGGTAPADLCIATGTNGNEFNFPSNNQQEGLFGGNPDLQEETSDTYTVGTVITPSALPGFSATLDYYKITVDDFISVLGGGVSNVLDLCYFQIQDANSAFCQAITRDPSTGGILNVKVLNANVSKVSTEGIDIALNYNFDIDAGLFDDGSNISLSFLGTYVINNEVWPIQDDPTNSNKCAGNFGRTCGEPDPKYRFNIRATWATGPLTLTTKVRWLDSIVDDRIALDGWTCCGDGDDLGHKGYAAKTYVDLSATYDVRENVQLYGGVRNLFNVKPPLTGDYDEQANTHPETYDAIGTRFFMGVKLNF